MNKYAHRHICNIHACIHAHINKHFHIYPLVCVRIEALHTGQHHGALGFSTYQRQPFLRGGGVHPPFISPFLASNTSPTDYVDLIFMYNMCSIRANRDVLSAAVYIDREGHLRKQFEEKKNQSLNTLIDGSKKA